MGYRYYNPNPGLLMSADDCTVRAISILLGMDWFEAYDELCLQGRKMFRMPPCNAVWGEYLREHGFTRIVLPDYCPNCYTIRIFAEEHPRGRYAVATGSHVVAVINGRYYDVTDSGDEAVTYYWKGDQ